MLFVVWHLMKNDDLGGIWSSKGRWNQYFSLTRAAISIFSGFELL
jgi:hypothetical protein